MWPSCQFMNEFKRMRMQVKGEGAEPGETDSSESSNFYQVFREMKLNT